MLLIYSPLGNSLAVELPALDRATLVRIQVSQPFFRSFCSFIRNSLCIGLGGVIGRRDTYLYGASVCLKVICVRRKNE